MSNRKKLIILGVVLVLLTSVFVYFKFKKPFDPGVDVKTFTTGEQLTDYYNKLNKLYEKDAYGGKTPEETIQLYIDALKKNEIELAAKYFIPEKQKQEIINIKTGLKSGGISKLLEFYEVNNQRKEYIDYMNEYFITFHDKDGGPGFVFDIGYNKATKVWKIISL